MAGGRPVLTPAMLALAFQRRAEGATLAEAVAGLGVTLAALAYHERRAAAGLTMRGGVSYDALDVAGSTGYNDRHDKETAGTVEQTPNRPATEGKEARR